MMKECSEGGKINMVACLQGFFLEGSVSVIESWCYIAGVIILVSIWTSLC